MFGKRKKHGADGAAEEQQQHLMSVIEAADDGPKGAQRILDDALQSAVVSLKFLCARELRRKGASRARLSEAQMERFGDAALRLFDSTAAPVEAKTVVLDPDVLTDILAPPSLAMAARHLTVAVVMRHIICSAKDRSSFYAFTRANISLSAPFARCARLGDVHTIALLEIAGWYPSGSPSDRVMREWPSIHGNLVEEKRRLIGALLDVGADVNAQGGRAFALASRLAGHDIVLEELLRDPDAVDGSAPSLRHALQLFLSSETQGDNTRVAALFSRALLEQYKEYNSSTQPSLP